MNDLFANTAEKLLGGDFICEYSALESYQYLCNEARRADIEEYLRRIGRGLSNTPGREAYYAVMLNLDSAKARQEIKEQMQIVINDLEPLVRWLNMIMSAQRNDMPLSPGDSVRESKLLHSIEDAPAIAEEIDALCKIGLFKNSNSNLSGKVRAIMSALEQEGYLVKHREGFYVATGKWAHLYEVVSFIASHEQLDTADDSSEQRGLDL